LFWQVVRIRNLLYRYVTQRPLTPGLTWFVRHYGRQAKARRDLPPRARVQSAAAIGGAGRGLVSLEVRVGTPDSTSGALREILELEQTARDLVARYVPGRASGDPRPPGYPHGFEIGVIHHFIKDRGDGSGAGLPEAHWAGGHPDPRKNPSRFRYARYFVGLDRHARNLAWLFNHYPAALWLVRGVDICTDELGVPTWVMGPLVKRVRAAADRAARTLRVLTKQVLPPFRTTAHAGEDYIHLLGGLRSVDHAIEYLPLSEGDRIGHGVALGVHPVEWARRAGRLALSVEDRLLDLAWEWAWYGRNRVAPGGDRQRRIEYQIAQYSEAVFGGAVAPFDLAALLEDLGRERALIMAGFPTSVPFARAMDARVQRLHHYLTDAALFRRGREVIWVDPADEGESLAFLQDALRRKVSARSLTVEVNPTSNLLIGDMGDLKHHPLWRLRPPRGDAPPVAVSVGSDDPIVFASNLREEYQWLCDALCLALGSSEEAGAWLDRTRRAGLDARFTLPLGPVRVRDVQI
ncbi:MAG TPA: hypothetical protein VN903_18085, partial [Polyangia bacterium]|nr:hypothetical protein [Polyangia bacterium]